MIILFTRAGLRVTLLLPGGLICMNNGAVLCDTEKIRIHHPDTGRAHERHLPQLSADISLASHITPTPTIDTVVIKYFSEILITNIVLLQSLG